MELYVTLRGPTSRRRSHKRKNRIALRRAHEIQNWTRPKLMDYNTLLPPNMKAWTLRTRQTFVRRGAAVQLIRAWSLRTVLSSRIQAPKTPRIMPASWRIRRIENDRKMWDDTFVDTIEPVMPNEWARVNGWLGYTTCFRPCEICLYIAPWFLYSTRDFQATSRPRIDSVANSWDSRTQVLRARFYWIFNHIWIEHSSLRPKAA